MQRWEAVPSPVSHVFWRQKRAFQLAEDTYADWVLFAVTEGRFRYGIGAARGEAGFGDLVFCPPQTTFHREVIDPVSFHFYTFRWSSLDGRVLNETSGPEPAPCGKISIRDHNRLSSTYFYLQQQLADGLPKERALALLRHLFTDLWLLGQPRIGAVCPPGAFGPSGSGPGGGGAVDSAERFRTGADEGAWSGQGLERRSADAAVCSGLWSDADGLFDLAAAE
ncbi:hypothetical protein LJK88_32540 [Paenibacillus sp. P26]|nr:hypothetical protein LJK88_32540 [Paenibacillus sp. P26]